MSMRLRKCVSEHWSEKIKEQATEGCNVAGMIHVNKVVGNFHLSPGRAFQRNNMHVHDLVPYLAGQGKEHHVSSSPAHPPGGNPLCTRGADCHAAGLRTRDQ
jgi:hypothetical protein